MNPGVFISRVQNLLRQGKYEEAAAIGRSLGMSPPQIVQAINQWQQAAELAGVDVPQEQYTGEVGSATAPTPGYASNQEKWDAIVAAGGVIDPPLPVPGSSTPRSTPRPRPRQMKESGFNVPFGGSVSFGNTSKSQLYLWGATAVGIVLAILFRPWERRNRRKRRR